MVLLFLNAIFKLNYHLLGRRKWQLTLVFFPEESHGQRSLAGCSPRGCKASDMTEATQHIHMHHLSEDIFTQFPALTVNSRRVQTWKPEERDNPLDSKPHKLFPLCCSSIILSWSNTLSVAIDTFQVLAFITSP